MTSRERVRRALRFEKSDRAIKRRNPPRIPLNYCNRDFEDANTLTTGPAATKGFIPSEPGLTERGYVWQTLDKTMGQPHTRPRADDNSIARYRPPDPFAPGRLKHLPQFTSGNNSKFLKFSIGISGFNAATFLRGLETFLTDLYLPSF